MKLLRQKEYSAMDYAGLSIGQASKLRSARDKIAKKAKIADKIESAVYNHARGLKNLILKGSDLKPLSKAEYKKWAADRIREGKGQTLRAVRFEAAKAKANILK